MSDTTLGMRSRKQVMDSEKRMAMAKRWREGGINAMVEEAGTD